MENSLLNITGKTGQSITEKYRVSYQMNGSEFTDKQIELA